MADWFVQLAGRDQGPFTATQLKQFADAGKINPDVLVKKGASTSWVKARQVQGLFSSGQSQQQAVPASVSAPPVAKAEPIKKQKEADVDEWLAADAATSQGHVPVQPASEHESFGFPQPVEAARQPQQVQTPVTSEASVPTPSTTRACPYCGEQILTVAKKCKHCGEFLDASGKPSIASAPQKESSAGPERTIWEGHPSGLYYIGSWICGVLLLSVFGIGLIWIIYAILDQRTKVFTLTNRRVMSKTGIISRRTQEVNLRDIRSINMNQTLTERLFSLGTVQIGSAGTGGIEVEFSGINKPVKVRDQVSHSKDRFV
jgi:membrane protein YdbS with pleckstrin-like domain